MLSTLSARLTYANVMSTMAVFLALCGSTYALTLPRNSVGTEQLKKGAVAKSDIRKGAVNGRALRDNAVTSRKVRDGSLVAGDFGSGELPVGAQGPAGPTGPTGPEGSAGPQGPQGVSDTSALEAHKTSGDHDGRYFTESELSSAGTINAGSNPVDWTRLKNVPSPIADGNDNVDGGNASLFDGLDSTQFLRSDTSDTFAGPLLDVTNDLDVEGVGRFDELRSDTAEGLDLRSDTGLRLYMDADNNSTGAFLQVFTCVDNAGACLVQEVLRLEEDGDLRIRGTLLENHPF